MIWLPPLVGCGFVWLFLREGRRKGRRKGRWTALAAGFSWFGYGLWEYGMKARILCSGECNIRVDLLLIYPFLLLISGGALIQSALWREPPWGQR